MNEENIKVNGDLNNRFTTMSQKIRTPFIKSHEYNQDSTLTAHQLIADKAEIQNMQIDKIISLSQNGEPMVISNDIILSSLSASESVNFISLLESDKKTNWELIHHDSFDEENSLVGWNINYTSICNKGQKSKQSLIQQFEEEITNEDDKDYYLGGHCLTSFLNLTKTFSLLPKHKNVRINAEVHLIDNWEGEQIFLMVDDKIVWKRVGNPSKTKQGIDICGGSHPEVAFGIPIDVIVPHSSNSITLTFGSNLQKHPCEASYAVDDVIIYLK